MYPPSDHDLRALLVEDPDRGWQAFVDRHTPMLVALIERLGVRDHDEAMELYTLVCERLSENDCARLRRRDPGRGSMGAWLAVVVRHVAVDWIRSRAGRRRLFGVIRELDALHQQVFELYYWQERAPSEIAEELTVTLQRPIRLLEVLAALDVIHDAMNDRHYSELVSMTARSKPPVSLDAAFEEGTLDPPDPEVSVEARVEVRERDASIEAALAALPAEDAAIVRLHYYQGLSLAAVERALHLPPLTRARLSAIVGALKLRLEQTRDASGRAGPAPRGVGGHPA